MTKTLRPPKEQICAGCGKTFNNYTAISKHYKDSPACQSSKKHTRTPAPDAKAKRREYQAKWVAKKRAKEPKKEKPAPPPPPPPPAPKPKAFMYRKLSDLKEAHPDVKCWRCHWIDTKGYIP